MPQSHLIAIIGIGCLFPESSCLKEYWRLIFRAQDAITDIPPTHWSPQDYFCEDPKKPDHTYCKRGGFLPPVSFDPSEFGIPPSSLEATDTSQLLGLVAAKMALVDAGYGVDRSFDRDRTSVILGVTGTQELVIPLGARLGYPKWRRALLNAGISAEKSEEVIRKISDSYVAWQENSFPGLLGNVVAGRISNRLDLGGTNCVVDAACASSMGAVHLAMLELMAGRCDMVVTGGVDTLNDIFMYMCFSKTHTLSPTGDIRPFSKHADGTVLGEGVGIVVLKRLEEAARDGNKIYAVIKGLGSSSDGKSQSIYAPSSEGQANALRMAYHHAGVAPTSVELVEAHGTGTRVGDQIEFQALKRVFGESHKSDHKCALGSVKSMIGHTKAAAGAAGLIKAALALHHKVIPPTLKVEKPDPKLNLSESPFYLSAQSRPWFSNTEHPRRAGVSAFGFGGSNFHVVLEEYQTRKVEIAWDGSVDMMAFSGSTPEELTGAVKKFENECRQGLSKNVCGLSAAKSRAKFSFRHPFRLLLVLEHGIECTGLATRVINALESKGANDTWHLENIFFGGPRQPGKTAFIFPGQGSQYVGMGRDLVCTFADAFESLENANTIFGIAPRLSDFIYPPPAADNAERGAQEKLLSRTNIAQPAIGAISLAMLKVLKRFGIHPDATGGHSFGELTALWAADWIDEDTFIRLSMIRGQLMAAGGRRKDHPEGSMLAVNTSLDQIEGLLRDNASDVILANRNSPSQGVLSGSTEAISRIEKICRQKGVNTKKLPVSAAFHSSLMRDVHRPFTDYLKKVRIRPTTIPVFSNTTGKPYPQEPEKARELLGKHLLNPVDFITQIENLYDSGVDTIVEVGPKSILSGLIKSILGNKPFQAFALDRSAGRRSGNADLAKTICHLASLGYPVSLQQWEEPLKETRKQKMNIPLVGANCPVQKAADSKKQTDSIKKAAENPAAAAEFRPETGHHRSGEPAASISRLDPPTNPQPEFAITMERKNKKQTEFILDALKVVQEGLKSMQTLHTQTAQTHQKFIEAQAEAGRTLQEMMQNTRTLALAMLEDKIESSDLLTSETTSIPELNPINAVSASPKQAHPQVDTKIGDQTGRIKPEVETTLLAVVSELTGYPIEMLGMEMDIEADLGIDSIKRVEILSTLEEKMPDLPAVAPEIMGNLKTLGQIIEYLTGGMQNHGIAGLSAKAENRADSAKQQKDGRFRVDKRPEVETTLLAVVSELTGYPIEMLGMEMDIEADLGIDSIKRVEILSTLEEKMPGLPAVAPEIMGNLKTLGQIVEHLTHALDPPIEPESPLTDFGGCISDGAQSMPDDVMGVSAEPAPDDIHRYVVTAVETPLPEDRRISIAEGTVFVTDDHGGLSIAVIDELSAANIKAVLISSDTIKDIKQLPKASGLIIVQGTDCLTQAQDLKEVFALTKHLAPDLLNSADNGGGIFTTITRLDGAFGFKGRGVSNPLQGGLAGLAKTAAVEWPNVCCHALDVSPLWKDNRGIAKAVVAEILTPGPVEIGLEPGLRHTLSLKPQSFPEGKINLNPGEVMVLSGGARGITAETAFSIAKYFRPTLVLLGRSPHPIPETEWLSPDAKEASIKRAILENKFKDKKASPAAIEKIFKSHMAHREICRNLERIKSTGADVRYYSVDIRNAAAVKSVLDEVRETCGPISAIIHGAGVLEDRLIIDKTPEQFERVFDTKVKGLEALLNSTRNDPLKYIVIYSSVAARFGNRGQVDYAMANEVLNKIAQQQSAARPDCRVLAINWGPWQGGMVNQVLRREFERKGIGLIAVETGANCILLELKEDRNSPAEVVIGAQMMAAADQKRVKSRPALRRSFPRLMQKQRLSLTFERELDVERYPILRSHIIGGKPVVPLALITEWFCHGALHENPGLYLLGLDQIRVLKGIRFEREKHFIRLLAGKPRKKGHSYEVAIELRDGKQEGKEIIHSRAKAILTERVAEPPAFNLDERLVSDPYPRSTHEVYDKILFHGFQLQGLRKIVSCSEQGMLAHIMAAPPPNEWMIEPFRNRWLTDPLVLDSAFQMATLWCYEQRGFASLPTYGASYRQYCDRFPSDGVTVILEIKEATRQKMRGDFTFLDANDRVVARLAGYEATMDASLLKAFKPQRAASA